MQKRKISKTKTQKNYRMPVTKTLSGLDVDEFLKGNRGPIKGHSPWNDPQDAGIPTDAGEVLHGTRWSEETVLSGMGVGLAETPIDRSAAVAEMQRQRDLPKGLSVNYEAKTPPYPWQAVENDKMRERLSECFTLLVKAIEKAAAIVAGREVPEPQAPAERPESTWNLVGPGTPLNAWLETKCVVGTLGGKRWDDGTNLCMCRIASIGDDPEWVEKEGGRTTVTHSTFAAPTHWRWPVS